MLTQLGDADVEGAGRGLTAHVRRIQIIEPANDDGSLVLVALVRDDGLGTEEGKTSGDAVIHRILHALQYGQGMHGVLDVLLVFLSALDEIIIGVAGAVGDVHAVQVDVL